MPYDTAVSKWVQIERNLGLQGGMLMFLIKGACNQETWTFYEHTYEQNFIGDTYHRRPQPLGSNAWWSEVKLI